MAENCTHDCNTCSASCSDREPSKPNPKDFLAPPNPESNVKKVIGVVSGKGGVGKSIVTSMLAVIMNRRGHKSAVLDADITGPSIPKEFGVNERPQSLEGSMLPVNTKTGIEIMSVNLLLEKETDPVVWRGTVIANTVKQFWSDVIWKDIDYMFVDMPPGTGDVPLTVFQSLPLDGIVIVTSPQQLVSMIVKKALKMAQLMNIPVLGIVENMSYFECPDCKTKHKIYGDSNLDEISKETGIDILGKIPMDKSLAVSADTGTIELFNGMWLEDGADILEEKLKLK